MSGLFGDGSSPSSSRSPSPQQQLQPRADYSSQGADWAGQGPSGGDAVMDERNDGAREGFAEDGSDEESEQEGDPDEDYTTTAAQTSSYGKEVKGLYGVDDVLPEEEFGEITIAELYELLKANCINLNPAYQREPVWKADRNEGLIQSIYRNVHVPELLFNVYASAKKENEEENNGTVIADPARHKVGNKGKGKEKETGVRLVWNCLDGKQRCTAIRKFLDGGFGIKNDLDKKVTFDRLTPEAQQIFRQKKLRFGYYRELSYEQECDIFRRVQLGMPLQGAETVKAINTEYRWWIDGLLSLFAPQDVAQQCENPNAFSPRIIELNRNKGLTLFFCLVSSLVGGYANTQHRTQVRRDKEMATLSLPSSTKRKMVRRILDRFKDLTLVPQLAEDCKDSKWPASALVTGNPKSRMRFPHRIWRIPNGKSAGRALSPVEFMFLPMLVQKYEDLRDGDLLEIIQKCRELVISSYGSEVKDNGKVWKTMKTFMDDFDPNTDLKGIYNDDGSRVVNGVRQPAQHNTNPTLASSHPAANTSPSAPPSAGSHASRSRSPETSDPAPSSSSTSKRKRRDTTNAIETIDASTSSSSKRKKVQQVDRDQEERVQREAREKEKRRADEVARETEGREARASQKKAEEERAKRKQEEQERERQRMEEKRVAKEKAENERVARDQLEKSRSGQELERRRGGSEEDIKPVISRGHSNRSDGGPTQTLSSRSPPRTTPSTSLPRDHPMQQRPISRTESRLPSKSVPSKSAASLSIPPSKAASKPTSGQSVRSESSLTDQNPAVPPRKYGSEAKTRIAEAVLSKANPLPPPPPPPTSRRAKPPSSVQHPSQPVQRKRIISNTVQQFDHLGRPKRPEQLAMEEDELEAYGGRGENDIIRPNGGAEQFDEEEEKNREVARLLQSRADPKDLEVMKALSQKKAGGPLQRFGQVKREEPDPSLAFSNHERRSDSYRERERSPARTYQSSYQDSHRDNGWARHSSTSHSHRSEYSQAGSPRQARGSISQTARYPNASSSRPLPRPYDSDPRR